MHETEKNPIFNRVISVASPPLSLVGSSPSPPLPSRSSSSPSLPPSPPSSCDSPPSTPKSPQEAPAPNPPAAEPGDPPKSLPFSIENILRPEFGNARLSPKIPPSGSQPSPLDVLRTPPKTPDPNRNDCPVDLSQKSSNNTKTNLPPSENKEKPQVTNDTSTLPDKTGACTNPRARYPENPEELANPKVPEDNMVWPAWVYCTRYSDRPSSGPRSRRIKRRDRNPEEKRPRTAFTSEQLSRLKQEFDESKYLSEKRRQALARELGLNESQIKIWFQNKRAKIKKTTVTQRSGLAQHLMAQGLYNHSTVPLDEDDPFLN